MTLGLFSQSCSGGQNRLDLVCGQIVATRPTVRLTRYLFRMVSADGQETIGESHLFARLRDGRVARWVEEADDEDYLSD